MFTFSQKDYNSSDIHTLSISHLKSAPVPVKHFLRFGDRMGKLRPEERWAEHVKERLIAFKVSKDFRRLRRKGLSIIGRNKVLTALEYWKGWSQWLSLPEYREWRDECARLGERFGLGVWIVEALCLLRDYRPDRSSLVAEIEWPRVKVVTRRDDPLFLQWLGYHAQSLGHDAESLGAYVVRRQGSFESTQLYLDYPIPPATELPPSSLPPRHTAFHMRVETPPGFPPEARADLEKQAAELERELLRKLGYRGVPQRLRSSPLVKKARKLKLSTGKLPPRGLYEIAAEIYAEGTEVEDRKRIRTLKTQRHRVRKRLLKPDQDG